MMVFYRRSGLDQRRIPFPAMSLPIQICNHHKLSGRTLRVSSVEKDIAVSLSKIAMGKFLFKHSSEKAKRTTGEVNP
jgi:hypothetical protein